MLGDPNISGPAPAVGGYTEGARVYHDDDQDIDHNTWTTLAFNSERYDTDGIHDVAVNNSRLTCKTAGKYVISITMRWEAETGGTYRRCLIQLGGGNTISQITQAGGPIPVFQQTTTVWDFAVGDYVEVLVKHDRGSAIHVERALDDSPEFMIQRIG